MQSSVYNWVVFLYYTFHPFKLVLASHCNCLSFCLSAFLLENSQVQKKLILNKDKMHSNLDAEHFNECVQATKNCLFLQ